MPLEPGDLCPACGEYYLEAVPDGECSCHIHSPCSACSNPILQCPGCGEVVEDENAE